MPVKNIYVPDDELTYWNEAALIAERQDISLSKLVSQQVRAYVLENHRGRALGLPVGFRIPESMKDPKVAAAELVADDIRERALAMLIDAIQSDGGKS